MKTSKKASGLTFSVSDVKLATKPLPEIPYQQAAARLVRDSVERPLESWSQNAGKLLQYGGDNNFVVVLNLAYNDHRPITLSPDMIWLLLMQGISLHVYANAAALRSRFVAHEGKRILDVQRDEFVRGFVGNDWEGVFSEFSDKIRTHIGPSNHALLVPGFSTTGPVEKAAFEVTLMDTVQSYFIYAVNTLCGIPAITLEGTPEDWEDLRERAAALERFDLEWWMPHLLPVLDQFIAAS